MEKYDLTSEHKADGIHKLSNAEYHATDALGSSQIGKLLKSPAHYKWSKEFPMAQTSAMLRGSLTHTLTLEPELFGEEYVICESPRGVNDTLKIMQGDYSIYDGATRRGKAWDKFKSENYGEILLAKQVEVVESYLTLTHNRTHISDEDYNIADALANAVFANPVAAELIEKADAVEESIFWTDFLSGIKCKCRPDLRIGNSIYDLKTTADASPRAFTYSAKRYGYDRQASWYLRGASLEHNVEEFGFIVVDKEQPYQCTVFHRLAETSLESGDNECDLALEILARCKESGDWPGYNEEYESIII